MHNPKAYSDWLTILKDIDAESPIVIFWGDNRYVAVMGSTWQPSSNTTYDPVTATQTL